MRPITILTLIPILVLCPFLCGAADSVFPATRSNPISDSKGPDRDCCPGGGEGRTQDTEDCLCEGVVQANGPRAGEGDGDHPRLPPSLDRLLPADHPAPSRLLAQLSHFGFLSGRAPHVGASRMRAVLQNFRC
ncbi:hypothetical protein ElP_72980 (plasmid) [Tautonia plasticadhaerens]|uniref:Uncharacterized protein n=1 Tax=Tautonia plasticadhaerens TaxID=2527974 RepID=A0A518HER1_9BACT|nr:hypothetical protein ElP_72980 [Tautonia plasticadhaerens]